jgi:N-acetylglucosaminyldiphosphoundecaprenol N-acetyl-beta-D-mannosaminyltransferase
LPDRYERDVHCLLGLPFDAMDLAAAVSRIRDAAHSREPLFLSTPNLNFLIACLTDEAFRHSVLESDLCIADGMPLVWVAWLLRVPIRERVAGSTLFEKLRGESPNRISVFFFGGVGGIAEAACRTLNSSTGGMVCVGFEFPGFGSVEEMSSEQTITRLNASGAHFVVVSLGAKKGQAWIVRNRDRLAAPVICHLGAVMNFIAGTVKRAPRWMQHAGLEWLWRIREEPGLWRRYFGDGMAFLRLLATRVVPYCLWMFCNRRAPGKIDAAAIDILERETDIEVRLCGAWMQRNLAPLRKCFSRAALAGKSIRLDLTQVTYVDSAFVGLLLLLYGDCGRNGRSFSLSAPQDRVRRIFRYSGAQFLLDVR